MTFEFTRIGIIILLLTLASCNNTKTTESVKSEEEQVVDELDKYMLEIKKNQKSE